MVAAGLVFLAATAGFIAVPRLVSGWAFVMPGMTDGALSPSFFPRVALICVAVAAIGVIMTAKDRDDVLPLLTMSAEDWKRVILVVCLIAGFMLGMVSIGFGASAMVFIALVGRLLGYRRTGLLLVTAALAPIVIVLVFRYGLRVLLPSGILF